MAVAQFRGAGLRLEADPRGLLLSDTQTKEKLKQLRKATSKSVLYEGPGFRGSTAASVLDPTRCLFLCCYLSLFGLKEICELSKHMKHLLTT